MTTNQQPHQHNVLHARGGVSKTKLSGITMPEWTAQDEQAAKAEREAKRQMMIDELDLLRDIAAKRVELLKLYADRPDLYKLAAEAIYKDNPDNYSIYQRFCAEIYRAEFDMEYGRLGDTFAKR